MDTLFSGKLLFTHIGSLKLENVFFPISITSLHVLASTPVSPVWLLQNLSLGRVFPMQGPGHMASCVYTDTAAEHMGTGEDVW